MCRTHRCFGGIVKFVEIVTAGYTEAADECVTLRLEGKIMREVGRYPLLEAILEHLDLCNVLSKRGKKARVIGKLEEGEEGAIGHPLL